MPTFDLTSMRVLHTSDWHLGHRLCDLERQEEHGYFLRWLLQTIEDHRVDLLLVAGDIFDTANPTYQAQQLYFNFLSDLVRTCCRHVVIIGGNHDSPGLLEAPREFFRHLNIRVVGKASEGGQDELVVLGDRNNPEMVVCAVPYLRDRDLRQAVAGAGLDDIEKRIKEGIIRRYQLLAGTEYVQDCRRQGIPVIATGHLFVDGGQVDGAEGERSEKEIHLGRFGQISYRHFPEEFGYIALGHLHRPQLVEGQSHIRYAGSPLPLSFSEADQRKSVQLLDYENSHLAGIESLAVPAWRKLVRYKGTFDDLEKALAGWQAVQETSPLPLWADLTIQTEQHDPLLLQNIRTLVQPGPAQVLKIQIHLMREVNATPKTIPPGQSLKELLPETVFRKRCTDQKFPLEEKTEILQAFKELVRMLEEQPE